MDISFQQIRKEILSVLNELKLPKHETDQLYAKLKYYMYVEDVANLNPGAYVRWIKIDDFQLTTGAIFVELKGDASLCLKNFRHQHFQIDSDECIVFQKLTNQELILLSAMDYTYK